MTGAAPRTVELPAPVPMDLGDDITLGVVDLGPRDAPAIIFLHGFPENHRSWRFQIAALSDRYRCIAPDQRGYGGSSRPGAVADYAPDRLIGDLFALADALGIDRFVVAGHDWGGAIAWGVALAGQPDGPDPARAGRVAGAIIANAPHPHRFQELLDTDPLQRAASQYIRAFRDPEADAVIARDGLAAYLRATIGWDGSLRMTPPERAALHAEWDRPGAATAMLAWYRAAPIVVPEPGAPFAPSTFSAAPFPKLSLPTLIVWGMADSALVPDNLDGLDALVEPLSVVTLPDCGHFTPWEAPEAVTRAIRAFLQHHPPV